MVVRALINFTRRMLGENDESFPYDVCIDENVITARFRDQTIHINLDQVTKITAFTTDDEPWEEDLVYWFDTKEGRKILPNSIGGISAVVDRLIKLPGFREKELIKACATTSRAVFVLWER